MVPLQHRCDRWHSFIQSRSKRQLAPDDSWECQRLSPVLLADRCVNRYHTARKTPCELWWQPALPLSTQQLSERPRGIRVVIYMLKIVTLPSPTPHVWINDSSILFSSKLLLTLVTTSFTDAAAGQGYVHGTASRKVCVCACLCIWEGGLKWCIAAADWVFPVSS